MITTLLALTDTFIAVTAGIALVVLLAFSVLWAWAMRRAYRESGHNYKHQGDSADGVE